MKTQVKAIMFNFSGTGENKARGKKIIKLHPVYHLYNHLKEIGTYKLFLVVKLYSKQLHIHEREHPSQRLSVEFLYASNALKNKEIYNNRI